MSRPPEEASPAADAARRGPAARALGALAAAGLLLLLLPLAHWGSRPLAGGDVFWQVRTGEIALETGRMPDRDPFSYTVPGVPWNNHEWGYEYLVALLHRAGGWGAIRIAVLLLVLATASGLALAVARRAGAPAALLVAVLFALFARYKMMPAPQTVSMALLLAAWHLFRGRRLAASPRRWAALALWMLAWGNLTAEALMFLPFLVVDQLGLRLAPGEAGGPALPSLRRHLLALAVVCAAPLVNPSCSSALEYALAGTAVNRAVNNEFAPIWAPAGAVTPLAKSVGIVLAALFVLWAAATLARTRPRAAAVRRLGPGLLAVALAVAFERNLWLLLLPAEQLAVAAASWARTGRRALAAGAAAVAAAAGLFAAYAAVLSWSPGRALRALAAPAYRSGHLNPVLLPLACLEPLAGDPTARRIFTMRMWASYAIWRLPEARVFIDGRNREYPLPVHEAALRIWEGGPDALQLLDASGTDAVVATPGWGDLPGIRGGPWRIVARGPRCALYRRAAGAPPAGGVLDSPG